jgi:hypothetical protein
MFSALDTAASYEHVGRNIDFGASGGSSLRYYPDLRDVTQLSDQGAVGLAVHTRRTHIRGLGSARYTPYYAMMLVPTAAPAVAGEQAPFPVDTVIDKREAYGYGTNVTVDQSLTGRSSLTFTYDFRRTQFRSDTTRYNSQSAGARYQNHLTKNLAIRLGYLYQQTDYRLPTATLPAFRMHDIDSGVDYELALGRTRRSTMGFSVGAGILETPSTRTYRALGDAWFNREIGRTWTARIAYHRGIGFADLFPAPFFSDSFIASTQGSLTRRLDFRASASRTTGDLGLSGATNVFDTTNGSTRLRFALTRMAAVYTEYVVYRYQFSNLTNLPSAFPRAFHRQGVRAGLTFWIPLYQ